MVQVVENLTGMRGRILARRVHPRLPDYDLVTVSLTDAVPVHGKADLLSRLTGTQVEVSVRRVLLQNAKPGDELKCRAKVTPDGPMCEPYPRDDEFRVITSARDDPGSTDTH